MVNAAKNTYSAMDWRQQIRKNERKTRWVIIAFVLLYLLVGLLVDCFINSGMYNAPLEQILWALITWQIPPYATMIMAALAAISLLITFSFHDRLMLLGTEYRLITPESAQSLEEKQLYHVVEEMKVAAGLSYIPKVYIIEADYMNAFASGFSEKSAMVAITRGLLEKLDRAEMQAVMAHELSHIRHHDIKLTLTVAILSNLMLIVIDMLFYSIIFGSRRRRDGDNRLAMVIIVLRYVLPVLTVILALFLSRTREYMADAGCVELMRDNEPLAKALMKINHDYQINQEQYQEEYTATAHEDVRRSSYLCDPVAMGLQPANSLGSMFSTHPSLNDRLKALGLQQKK